MSSFVDFTILPINTPKEENLASSLIRYRLANDYRDTVSIIAEISDITQKEQTKMINR
jgi:hypothetical protein